MIQLTGNLSPLKGRRFGMRAVVFAAAVAFCLTGQVRGARAQKSPKSQPAGAKGSKGTDSDELKQLIARYAKSVDTADTTLASQIWSHSSDVSFIFPLGWEHGFDQVEKNVYERAMAETFSERKLTIHDISLHVYGDAAWAEFSWDFAAKLRKDGSPMASQGQETQVYRKEPGGWRLVHVHYSGVPVTGKGQGF